MTTETTQYSNIMYAFHDSLQLQHHPSIRQRIRFQLKIFEHWKDNCNKRTSSGEIEGEETREDLVASRRESVLGAHSQLEISALQDQLIITIINEVY